MDVIFQLKEEESFRMVIEEIIHNLHTTTKVTVAEIDKNVIDAGKDFIRTLLIKQNFDIDNIAAEFQNNDWNRERVEYLLSLLRERRNNVLHLLINHHNSLYGDTLIEFDWLLKLVLGSSESKSLKYSLLQLLFSSVNANGNQTQTLYEVNKESLCKLISVLEEYSKTENV